MKKLGVFVLVLVLAMAQQSFVEKAKQKLQKQRDLAATLYSLKDKKSGPILIGTSADPLALEEFAALQPVTEYEKADPTLNFGEIKFIESMYIVSESNNPNFLNDERHYEGIATKFPKVAHEWSKEKLHQLKENCIYVFSECNFKGNHQKTCTDQQTNLLSFPFVVKSMALPKGSSLVIKEEESQHQINLSSSVKCLETGQALFEMSGTVEATFGENKFLS